MGGRETVGGGGGSGIPKVAEINRKKLRSVLQHFVILFN